MAPDSSAPAPRIAILGVTGNIGRAAARAFLEAGWHVTGFSRNPPQMPGLVRIAGDASDPAALRAAVKDADVVLNALNLPYHRWFGGRAEAQLAAVLAAVSGGARTLLFPGNVYNYPASARRIAPDTPQAPERPRGAVRQRMEEMLATAAARGEVRVILLRAGDFYGPGSAGDWFGQMILREFDKGRVALPRGEAPHAFAYLPDLARAFVRLAEARAGFSACERFHFPGHFVTPGAVFSALEAAAGRPLRRVPMPWGTLRTLGLVMPLMREIVRMRYLWEHPMELVDPRLEALLGPGFATPFPEAVAETLAPYLSPGKPR